MRVGWAVAGIVIAAAACGSSAAAPTAAAPCGPASAKTLVQDGRARIYSRDGGVYGCANGHQHVYVLGRAGLGRPGQGRVGLVALAGVDAGYSLSQMGVDTISTQVVVRRLDSGRTIRDLSAVTGRVGPEFFESVTGLVVKSDGAVAWIAKAGSIIRHGSTIEVDRADRRGEANLDGSAHDALRSLALRGSQLSWRHGAAIRTAQLL